MTTPKIYINSNNDKKFKAKLAVERGKRVKLARNIAGLSRKEIFERYNINPNTIRAWEQGVNLITEKKVSMLTEIFSQEGVSITTEWLLYGEDLTITQNQKEIKSSNKDLREAIRLRGDLKTIEEVNYFLDNNLNSVSCLISDDSLSPIFCIGDYVGGIKYIGKKINELVGEFCVIITNDEKVFPKKIFSHKEKNTFLVGDINPFAKSNAPHHFSCEIRAAAKITRHWRLSLASKKSQLEDI